MRRRFYGSGKYPKYVQPICTTCKNYEKAMQSKKRALEIQYEGRADKEADERFLICSLPNMAKQIIKRRLAFFEAAE